MGALANPRNIVVLLLILTIVAALAVGSVATRTAPTVSGQPGALPNLQVGPARVNVRNFIVTEADEIDPEACLIVTEKEEEEVTIAGTVFLQEIITVISACNVDDEIRPPNLERELDVDIEVFSLLCNKDVDLNRDAVCTVVRVAQEENLESGGGRRAAPAPEPAEEPVVP